MRFGLYINPQTPGPDDDGRIIDEVMGQIELAEQLGFEDVWLTEHHFSDYNAYTDPIVLAAAISQRTTKMTIGFSLAVVPLHHPVRFATQCNLLDRLSNGRLIIGVGPGNCPDEFVGYGLKADERHEMIDEFMEICEQIWNAPPAGFEYHGRYWQGAVKGRIIPSPVQPKHPHVAWATLTPDTIERTGRLGYSWLIGPQNEQYIAPRIARYMKGMDEGDLDDAARARAWFGTGMLRQVYCAAPGENWLETLEPYIDVYVRASAKANTGIDDLPKDDFDKRKEGYLKNWLFAGTAEELVEKFKNFPRLGVQHLMCWTHFGYMPDEMIRASLYRFTADVMPALRDISFDPAYVQQIIDETPATTQFWTPTLGTATATK